MQPLPDGLAASFDVIRPLGAGGMGAVWLVRDRFLDRAVALKVLLQERTVPEARERFLREARTSARLEHPHIIDVYRADETDGVVWFTMQYIEGESLGDRLRDRGPLPAVELLRILREVAWGLAYAHARGVVHRDIKPDNILLEQESGRAVLTDFGIARDIGGAHEGLTLDGHVLGTVHYMSPEQASGEVVDHRSDLYAVGVIAYQAVTGRLPFDGPPQAVLVAHVTREAPPVASVAPEVSPKVAAVIERCLRKHPDDRFPSADALAAALDAALREAEAEAQQAADAAPGGVLSEGEALAIWQRAAQLQAEAAHRMEKAATLRASGSGEGDAAPSGSYRVRDVEAAAVDAGISRQYVALALAEREANRGRVAVADVSDRLDRQMTTMMGTTDRAISVSHVVPAGAKQVLQAIGEVFTAEPYRFTFAGTVNGHPLDGGILRFTVPRLTTSTMGLGIMAREKRLLYRLEQIELFDLNVTLHARGSRTQPACEVVITGDLRPGLLRNLKFDWGMIAGSGLLAGGLTGSALGAIGLGAATVAVPVVAGASVALLAGGSTAVWYRWLFRRALEQAKLELLGLLQGVERHFAKRALFGGEGVGFQALIRGER